MLFRSLHVYLSKNFISIRKMFSNYYRYVIASIFMGIIVYFAGNVGTIGPITTILQVTAGMISYVIILLLMKDEDIINTIKMVCHNKL